MEKEYRSNSYASRKKKSEETPEKKVDKIVSGTVKTKKKNKILKSFVSEDASSVKSFIFSEVLIPTVKKLIEDIVNEGVHMIFYGESGGSRKRSTGSKISYRKYYDDREAERRRYRSTPQLRGGFDYDDIILDSRGEAEAVLDQLDTLIDQYDSASIADLYDLVGLYSDNYQNNKFGWFELQTASIQHVREGYLLRLPRAVPLT